MHHLLCKWKQKEKREPPNKNQINWERKKIHKKTKKQTSE